jgi:hypothetical protein
MNIHLHLHLHHALRHGLTTAWTHLLQPAHKRDALGAMAPSPLAHTLQRTPSSRTQPAASACLDAGTNATLYTQSPAKSCNRACATHRRLVDHRAPVQQRPNTLHMPVLTGDTQRRGPVHLPVEDHTALTPKHHAVMPDLSTALTTHNPREVVQSSLHNPPSPG